MPLIKSAIKKMKQDKRRYAQNIRTKRNVKSAVNTFKAEPTFDNLRSAQSAIDVAAKKHVISKPAAARRIAHLSAFAKEHDVKIVAVKKPAAKTTKTVKSVKK